MSKLIKFRFLSLTVAFCLSSIFLLSCVSQKGVESIQKDVAKLKLEQRLAAKKLMQPSQVSFSGGQAQGSPTSDSSGQAQIQDQSKNNTAALLANYDPHRLMQAATPRQWQNIRIPDLNIDCWLKSTWVGGRMNLRLALMGDKTALRLFTSTWPYFRLVFSDQGGVNLHQAILRSTDLRWADSLRNSGAPTMEFESYTEMPLEDYERAVQWHVKWEEEI